MTSSSFPLSCKSIHGDQELFGKYGQENEHSKLDLGLGENPNVIRHVTEEITRSNVLQTSYSASISNPRQFSIDDSSVNYTSVSPAPLCRQFWKAGDYDDKLNYQPTTRQTGATYLRIHPKFLHSNATAHKWVFGAIAELLDNSLDEVQNGATSVTIDKITNPRDGTPALLFQDNGGGMDPDAMRRCISFGFSDKNSETAIGKYGNGFKTGSMRLGADVVVFSRHMNNSKCTQSVGLLSYTFLMQTGQDRIVVPVVDYEFCSQTGTWNIKNHRERFEKNVSILLQWSPFTTEAELLKQCDDIGLHGTKIVIYNLWHTDEGKLELDFESDPEDIVISGHSKNPSDIGFRMSDYEKHLANRLKYSLRAYLSILYLRVPESFNIFLRGRVVDIHNIASDLKFPEFIRYRPQNMEDSVSVITTIGFLKEAPAVNIHGFNVYYKNRLILPFWRVVSTSTNRTRGVVGVLEANFMEPTHNKQDFEKTPVFQKLESRLKDMALEYWDYHCELIGYKATKKPRATIAPVASSENTHCIYQPVLLGKDISGDSGVESFTAAGGLKDKTNASLDQMDTQNEPTTGTSKESFHQTAKGLRSRRRGYNQAGHPGRAKRMNVNGPPSEEENPIDTADVGNLQHAVDNGNGLEENQASPIIQANRTLRLECQEYEKTQKELKLKVMLLNEQVQEARSEYARLFSESDVLEKIRLQSRAVVL